MLIASLAGALPVRANIPAAPPYEDPVAEDQMLHALTLMKQGQWTKAKDILVGVGDPMAARLYAWYYFRKNPEISHFSKLAHFLDTYPDWPESRVMTLTAEKQMPQTLPPAEVASWFDRHAPMTPDGMERYISALQATGQEGKAARVLNEWWKTVPLTASQQERFLLRYKGILEREAHKARFDSLLFSRNYTNAKKLASLIGQGYGLLAEARIALAENKESAQATVGKVPLELRNDPGLRYERLRWRRRNDLNDRAIEILDKAPPPGQVANPQGWWEERHILTRRLIEARDYKGAYRLVSNHQQTDGLSFAQAEWLAGWLALRFLNEPWKAFEHFERLYQKVETPISKSRGAYWAGRASDALGYPQVARQWYKMAEQYKTTFYGQLASGMLDSWNFDIRDLEPAITPEQRALFNKRDLVRAARLLAKAEMMEESEVFVKTLGDGATTPEDLKLAGDLAEELHHYTQAIRIGKNALQKGVLSLNQSYPVILSLVQGLQDVDWALIHAIIRQESQFDFKAMSPVGARGLMQLMPATANETAKKLEVKHKDDWLTSRPEHNVVLGSAYIKRLLKSYDGSFVLAIAAYNAGPGRVNGWLKENGDPRTGQISYIDWIEMIPVYETRNYVQRVIEGMHIYRKRLKDMHVQPQDSKIHTAFRG